MVKLLFLIWSTSWLSCSLRDFSLSLTPTVTHIQHALLNSKQLGRCICIRWAEHLQTLCCLETENFPLTADRWIELNTWFNRLSNVESEHNMVIYLNLWLLTYMLEVPRSQLKRKGDWAFAIVGPKLWNSLPFFLLELSLQKIHLLEKVYNIWVILSLFFLCMYHVIVCSFIVLIGVLLFWFYNFCTAQWSTTLLCYINKLN